MPSKVGFFAWDASWGTVLTLNNLKRRVGVCLIGASFVVKGKKPLIIC